MIPSQHKPDSPLPHSLKFSHQPLNHPRNSCHGSACLGSCLAGCPSSWSQKSIRRREMVNPSTTFSWNYLKSCSIPEWPCVAHFPPRSLGDLTCETTEAFPGDWGHCSSNLLWCWAITNHLWPDLLIEEWTIKQRPTLLGRTWPQPIQESLLE